MSLVDKIGKENGNFLEEYEELTKQFHPVDLGLGYPNYPPHRFVIDALSETLRTATTDDHQYTNPKGHPRLTNALSKLYSQYVNRIVDPETEILVTSGSSEALFCAVMGLISPGDEVIVIEPYFAVFVSLVKMAGGIPKFTSLKFKPSSERQTSADWVLDLGELEQLFTRKTKAIILNTPHNPTGKVFDLEELSFIAELCRKFCVVCISDEVYERMVYKPKNHIRIASLPGMFERTVTIGAAEKSFGVTGWQIGWVYGPSDLLKNLTILHQLAVFNASSLLQIAFARMLENEYEMVGQSNSYFEPMEMSLRQKRDHLVQILSNANINPIVPDGGMFILGNISQIVSQIDLSTENDDLLDLKFVKWLTKNHRLQTFPVTLSWKEENRKDKQSLVRFCFAKKKETLDEALKILEKL